MKTPDKEDLKEIGVSEIRIYSRIYKIWGYKQYTREKRTKRKNSPDKVTLELVKDSKFFTASFLRYTDNADLKDNRSTTEQFALKNPVIVRYPEVNFEILKIPEVFKKLIKIKGQKQFNNFKYQLIVEQESIDISERKQLTPIINAIEPKMKKENGDINWWWIVWNIGKVIALFYAKDAALKRNRETVKVLKLHMKNKK